MCSCAFAPTVPREKRTELLERGRLPHWERLAEAASWQQLLDLGRGAFDPLDAFDPLGALDPSDLDGGRLGFDADILVLAVE